eukprot:superscaffoldBa00001101_g8971
MDALSKTAVMEISKLVEIESKMLKIEITRGRNEIASLTEKLQLMEKLLYIAQGSRQDAVAATATCSVLRDDSQNGILEPDRTRPAIKSESPWENISSSTETSSLHQGEEHSAAELTNPLKEQPELIVIKEEPSEEENRDSEQDRTSENRREVLTDPQKSPEVIQRLKPVSEHQQPMFTDSFVTLSTQSSLTGPGRRDTQWNPQLTTVHTNMMCDTTNRSFRTQLAAILEKLTKAALVEIGNLADECSSVLHTEISLHKTENEALKKRCYSLEVQLRAAREAQTYPAHANSIGRRHPAGQDGQISGQIVFIGSHSGGVILRNYLFTAGELWL